MGFLLRLLLSIVITLVVLIGTAWALGMREPVSHSISISDEVHAPLETTWALITNLPAQPGWRTGLESVEMLPPSGHREHWREQLAYGQTMTFVADQTVPQSLRVVRLDEPGASYTGSWIYELSPGAAPGRTRVRITEAGNIYPPLYRFMMKYIFGSRKNLDQYMSDLKAAPSKL